MTQLAECKCVGTLGRKGACGHMWKGYYGREPFDLRLTALRMFSKLPMIMAVTVLGSLLLGGAYYVRNVLLGGEKQYEAVSRYRVEYAVEEEKDVGTVYINEVSWNTYLGTDLFLDGVKSRLAKSLGDSDPAQFLSGAELKAVLASDLRVLATVVTADSPERSVMIAKAVEETLTEEFASEIREIVSIGLIESGDGAAEVVPDVRVGRAFVLSGVLSCFFVILALLLKETGDDSIWLPSSLWKRYGLKTVGTKESKQLPENLKFFFPETLGHVALWACEEEMRPEEILEELRRKCPDTVGKGWFAVEGAPFSPGAWEELGKADAVLLAVQAGSHRGRRLERVLEHLEQRDCHVTAALLWDADEKLLSRYYFGKRSRGGAAQQAKGRKEKPGTRQEEDDGEEGSGTGIGDERGTGGIGGEDEA